MKHRYEQAPKSIALGFAPCLLGYAGSCRDEDDAKQIKKGQEQSERAAVAFVHGVLRDSFLSFPVIHIFATEIQID